MYIDAYQKGDKIYTWIRDKNGKLSLEESKAPYYLYVPSEKKTGLKTIYGNSVVKKTFKNRFDFYRYVDRHDYVYESDFSPLYKHLSDEFYKVGEDCPVNVAFFDIEAFVDLARGQHYPTPNNPYGEVNGISMFDVKHDKYYLLVLDPSGTLDLKIQDDEGKEIEYFYCVTEKQLLKTFCHLIKHIDVLVTWNGKFYDIPYLMERMKKHFPNSWKKLLCRDNVAAHIRQDDKDRFGNPCTTYKLTGRIHLDMQELYRKFVQKKEPSYALNWISKKNLNEEKVDYKGDLGKLYLEDPIKFYEYALQDTRLLFHLENKLKFVDLAISMARKATIRFDEVIGSIKYLEHSIRNYCHYDRKHPLVLPDRQEGNKKEKFDGGFVADTKPGLYGWTMSSDLASLYPSIIRALNISPETHIFQCAGRYEDFVKITDERDDEITLNFVGEKDSIVMPAYEVKQMLKDEHMTITANGSILVYKRGIIPEILDIWYEERKDMKDKMLDYKREGNSKLAGFYDIRQNLAKVSLNSLYGAISHPSSRFYSLDLAASVTITGQMVNKFQIWKADMILGEKHAV